MKDETLSTDSTHKNKKLVPSFSVPNFKEKNNSNITDNNNNYRLNFNYDFNKMHNFLRFEYAYETFDLVAGL